MASVDVLHQFSEDDMRRALEYASNKLGYSDGFRTEQSTALKSLLRGHDLFVSLPTGFGKSVIFQAAPLCVNFLRGLHGPPQDANKKAIALIVMPLKSLISDQMSRAGEVNIDAADLTGGITDTIREGLSSAKYSLLFASPEVLLGEDGHELFNIPAFREQLCGLFIDESHCVSKWGCSSNDTKAFRAAYGKLGEVRARFHSAIPTVALTATATKEIRRAVADNLGLRNFVLIDRSPERRNIRHVVVRSKTKNLDHLFKWMADDIVAHGAATERTVIYCSSRKMVSDLYSTFLHYLPKIYQKHVNMFHTNTERDVQETIINSFADAEGELRVLIATIAYGMGVDCKGLHRAIIFGRTVNLEDYMQMSGRIGRDNKQSTAVTVLYPGDSLGRKTSNSMNDFFQGNRCRREIVREVFGAPHGSDTSIVPHDCCDVCSSVCKCSGDTCGATPTSLERGLQRALEGQGQSEELKLNIPSPAKVDQLERALQDFKTNLVIEGSDHIYCREDIVAGFSDAMIQKIMKDCNVEISFRGFLARYDFPSRQMAADVWLLVCTTLGRDAASLSGEYYSIDEDTDYEEFDSWSDSEFQEAVIGSDSEDD